MNAGNQHLKTSKLFALNFKVKSRFHEREAAFYVVRQPGLGMNHERIESIT